MNTENNIVIFKNPDALSGSAGHYIITLAKKCISKKGSFVISLSGGRTPEKLFALLAQPEYQQQVDWQKTFIFWGDERCVPLDDERNNAHVAKTLLLDKINIPAANIFPIPVNLSHVEAANQYEEILKHFFVGKAPVFDLILLGLGEDGHTASLFPMTDVIHERRHWIRKVYMKEQRMFRITMTVPLINQAANILFLVTGKEKAHILNAVLTSDFQPEKYPVQFIKPANGNLYWYIDEEAAFYMNKHKNKPIIS